MEHPYIVQRAGEAVYSAAGKAQLKEQVAYYMNNAQYILKGLQEAGFTVSGGVNAPYIWLKAPNGMTSWEFFDYLLENVNVVGTPGSGFGPSGEHYFRLTAFGSYENTVEAVDQSEENSVIDKPFFAIERKWSRCTAGKAEKSNPVDQPGTDRIDSTDRVARQL